LSVRHGSTGLADRLRQASTGVVIGWHGWLGVKRQVAVTAMPLPATVAPELVSVAPLTPSSRTSAEAVVARAPVSASAAVAASAIGVVRRRACRAGVRHRGVLLRGVVGGLGS
jgi:hypothetical protein